MTGPAPSNEQLKAAFKAFKKRLKLTQLDFESRLGGSPVTSGRSSGIVGIVPPIEFPAEVWEELVRQVAQDSAWDRINKNIENGEPNVNEPFR